MNCREQFYDKIYKEKINNEISDGEIKRITDFEAGYRDFGGAFNYSKNVKELLCQKLDKYRDHLCPLCQEKKTGIKVERTESSKSSSTKEGSAYGSEDNCEAIEEMESADK